MSYYTKLVTDHKSKSPDFDKYARMGMALHDAAKAVNVVANTNLDELYELILEQAGGPSDADLARTFQPEERDYSLSYGEHREAASVAAFRAIYFLAKFRAFAATVDTEAQALLAVGDGNKALRERIAQHRAAND